MRGVYCIASALLLLALLGCGNKGDLFLPPSELSEEQKALLGEQINSDAPANGTGSTDSVPENANVPGNSSELENDEPDEKKKKNTGNSGNNSNQ